MRLLKFDGQSALSLTEDLQKPASPYAILSHTWGNDRDEVTFDDVKTKSWKNKAGYKKIRFCGEQAKRDELEYFWVDTCCIDKANNTEYSEAINSMFSWYRNAAKCYVYLFDVSVSDGGEDHEKQRWKQDFRKSRWFTRGWTLQELLAPASVKFFSQEGEYLGDKKTLEQTIHEITMIPVTALGGAPLSQFSVDERMRWATNRVTKKKEDEVYCLLGIFDISMSLRYGEGEKARDRLKEKIDKSLQRQSIETIDTWIREKCYSPTKLKIERLSGNELPMDQCYINLAIVQQHPQDTPSSRDRDAFSGDNKTTHGLSPFSLPARLHLRERNEGTHIPLSTIFDLRNGRNGREKQPRRILIRGQAGVGKTTLCKKMVYDFAFGGLWTHLFSRILWIPLRKLKGRAVGYKVQNLFSDIFFLNHEYPDSAALELHKAINSSESKQTLFVLDGLDEVSRDFGRDSEMFQLLLYLLNQPNVVVTSRPYGLLPSALDPLDLELETIGFYPEQVKIYLERTFPNTNNFEEIHSFIQDHWLLEGLVRIPIQLDALCLTWDGVNTLRKVPKTMTAVYRAIERKLWKKDLLRLEKMADGKPLHDNNIRGAFPSDIEDLARGEILLLEILAFTGLHNDVVNFDPKLLDMVFASAIRPKSISLPDRVLANISFLRTSDPSSQDHNNYHFLHLTFQEYFAARYLVRQWKAGQQLECLQLEDGSIEKISPIQFIQRHKYLIRYDIFWRFVTGLLQIKNNTCLVCRFFDVLEGEPHDLLGPVHQRLIIHCLSEIDATNDSFQKRARELEDNYLKWTLFESRITSSTNLIRELECPERIFKPWLEGSDHDKMIAMSSLTMRTSISQELSMMVISEASKTTDAGVRSAAFKVLGIHHSQVSEDKFLDLFTIQSSYLRIAGVKALASCPTLVIPALKAMIQLLKDEDSSTQSAAAEALGRQTHLPPSTIEALTQLLQHKSSSTQTAAIKALKRQTRLPDSTIKALTHLLQHEDSLIRSAATEYLEDQTSLPESAVETLTQLLSHGDYTTRSTAVKTLGRQTSLSQPTFKTLLDLLRYENVLTRLAAADVLKSQTSLPEFAVETLTQLLPHGDYTTRSTAVKTLGRQTSLSQPTSKTLIDLLRHENVLTRLAAADVLESQTSLPEFAVETLTQLLPHGDDTTRSAAVKALGSQTHLQPSTIEALTQLLQHESSSTRATAITALGGQDSLPESTIKDVTQFLWHEDSSIRSAAVKALGSQTHLPPSTIKALTQLLQHESSSTRAAAITALGGQDSLSNFTIEAMIPLLQDEDMDVQIRTTDCLRRQTIPEAHIILLRHRNSTIRYNAARTLRHYTNISASIIEKITQLFQDKEPDVRYRATEALGGRSGLPIPTVNALTQLLQDTNFPVRNGAATILRLQDSLPISAVKSLLKQLRSNDASLRFCAATALDAHTEFYSDVPALDSSLFHNLFISWLQLSFKKPVTCLIVDDALSISIYGRIWRVALEESLRQRIHAIRRAIGVPC